MVVSCSVVGCKNRHDKTQRRSFFSFPLQDDSLLAKWIEGTGRLPDWKPTKFSKICSDHFESRFINNHWNYVKLHPGAYPRTHNKTQLVQYKYDHDYFLESYNKESRIIKSSGRQTEYGSSSYSSLAQEMYQCQEVVKTEPVNYDDYSSLPTPSFVVSSVTSLNNGLGADSSLEPCSFESILPHSQTDQREDLERSNFISEDTPGTSNANPFTNAGLKQRKRKRFFPATCSPATDDSPVDLQKKLKIIVAAYTSLKKKHKTLLQYKRRLETRFKTRKPNELNSRKRKRR